MRLTFPRLPGACRDSSASADAVARLWRVAWFVLLGCLAGLSSSVAAAAAPTEDELKAAFVLNFPKYVEWPPEVFDAPDDAIVLSVLGDRALADELRRMTEGRTYQGRAFVVCAAADPDEIRDCHILFLGAVERRRVPAVLKQLGTRHVLTVGEYDEFLADGGMINLARRDRKIRLEINLAAVTTTGLRISSKLLGVADVVQGRER